MIIKLNNSTFELLSASFWRVDKFYDSDIDLNILVIKPCNQNEGEPNAIRFTCLDGTDFLLGNVRRKEMGSIARKLYNDTRIDLTELMYLPCNTDTECPWLGTRYFTVPFKAIEESPFMLEKFGEPYLILALHSNVMRQTDTSLQYEKLAQRYAKTTAETTSISEETDDYDVDFEDEVAYDDGEEIIYDAETDEECLGNEYDEEEEIPCDLTGEVIFNELGEEINPENPDGTWTPEYCPFS